MRLLILLVLTSLCQEVAASHLLGGYIQINKIGPAALTFEVSAIIFRDIDGIHSVDGVLDFGDGVSLNLTPQDYKFVERVSDHLEIWEVKTTHTYAAPGFYSLGYREAFRNSGIVNIEESDGTYFYLECGVLVDLNITSFQSPRIYNPDVGKGYLTQVITYNPAVIDSEGDSLSYQLMVPKSDRGTFVKYTWPNDEQFYEDFLHGNSSETDRPVFISDQRTGTIFWDSPGTDGSYGAALKIFEWRRIAGVMTLIGYTVLDIQFEVLLASSLGRPTLVLPKSDCYTEGISERIGVYEGGHKVRIKLLTDAENATLNDIEFNEFVFSDEFQMDDILVDFTLTGEQATRTFHVIYAIVEIEDGHDLLKWSDGSILGFDCQFGPALPLVAEEINKEPLAYYSQGYISVLASSESGTLRLFDLKGSEVLSHKVTSNEEEIAVNLQRGLYISLLQVGSQVYRSKILIN